MDIGSIAALTASLQSAVEIARALIGLRDATAIQGKVIELQGVIMAAQSSAIAAQTEQFALLEKVRCLEKQLAEVEDWRAEREKYSLKRVDRGAFVYVPKLQGADPPYWLCAACFQKGKKNILQYHGRPKDQPFIALYRCPDCSAEIRVHPENAPDAAWG